VASLDLDHLEALIGKPGALPGSTALEQARAAGKCCCTGTCPYEHVVARRAAGGRVDCGTRLQARKFGKTNDHPQPVAELARLASDVQFIAFRVVGVSLRSLGG
jgi:hypothetical protein